MSEKTYQQDLAAILDGIAQAVGIISASLAQKAGAADALRADLNAALQAGQHRPGSPSVVAEQVVLRQTLRALTPPGGPSRQH